MRKTIGMFSVILLCLYLAEAQSTWKLSKNVLATSNQISFDQGSQGTWYFLKSNSFAHDPKTYQFLPVYSLPCNLVGEANIDAACWEVAAPDTEGSLTPIVGANASYKTQVVAGFVLPPRSVWMHPGNEGYAIVGWKSPISGFINVTGIFSDLDPTCGNGVIWLVESGGQKLSSGTLVNGGAAQSFNLNGIFVNTGQVLYFIVGPNGDYHCDSTGFDVSVTKAN